jgi:cell fate regulator YaaT (PSP1 superfamily)
MSNVIQVTFKSHRRDFFDNKHNLHVKVGDYVIVQAESGVDLGVVTMDETPEALVPQKELRTFVRLANPDEIHRVGENRADEVRAEEIFRQKVEKSGLKMKLVEAEYQFDRRRIVFYFTADKRVDFRSLVRDLAAEFRTRIELRQIGVRDEAKRVGGYGPCGKELCCSAHLQGFQPITTEFARDQGLQLNPSKLTGLCGRLKCCLAYERDFYVNTLSKFPGIGDSLRTARGTGEIKHVDIIGNKVYVKHRSEEEWETLRLEEVASLLGLDLNEVYGCPGDCKGGEGGCRSSHCETHAKVESGAVQNPLKEFMENDPFFKDHKFPRPAI